MTETLIAIESILDKWNNKSASLISILLDIQSEYNYLSKEALIMVADRLNIPLIRIYSIATFYKVFSLKPRGKHIINVCVGTACHVRGGHRIVDEVKRKLDINVGETTEDKLLTLETVRCLGCCAVGPVVVIDNNYSSYMIPKKVDAVLNKYKKEENI